MMSKRADKASKVKVRAKAGIPVDACIVTAYAEPASGPGWTNSPLWVVWRNPHDNQLHQGCFQPTEQTREMALLYAFSALAHQRMTRIVEAHLRVESW